MKRLNCASGLGAHASASRAPACAAVVNPYCTTRIPACALHDLGTTGAALDLRDTVAPGVRGSVFPCARLALLPNVAWDANLTVRPCSMCDGVLPADVWRQLVAPLRARMPVSFRFLDYCALHTGVTDRRVCARRSARRTPRQHWWCAGVSHSVRYIPGSRTRHMWAAYRRTWLHRYGRFHKVHARDNTCAVSPGTAVAKHNTHSRYAAGMAPCRSCGIPLWRLAMRCARHMRRCVATIDRTSRRLALLLRQLITWTSGEAYVPGPRQRLRRAGATGAGATGCAQADVHVNDVRYRFHNVHGMADARFRGLYLERARATCEVLGVVETNWATDAEATRWSSDWSRSSGVWWSLGRTTARGVGLFFADSLGDVAAKVLWRDDEDGRGLAVQATIHGRTTVVVVFHADVTGGDDAQERSYERLRRHVPVVAGAEYIWMLDANNITCTNKDGVRSDGVADVQTHPCGVRGLQGCLSDWGGLMDAYRHVHADGREYTHSQTVGATESRGAYRLARRLDRIYVSRSMTERGVPHAAAARHVWPTSPELVALKRTGSQSRWSDHAAVEVCMRYTTTVRTPSTWTYPRHRLVNDVDEVKRLRAEVRGLHEEAQRGIDPRALLHDWLRDTAARVQREERVARRTHTADKGRVLGRLRVVHDLVGDGVGRFGSVAVHPADGRQRAERHRLEGERSRLEDELADIYTKEQRLWCANRGYEEFVHGERCSRKFFDGMRSTRAFSYIHKALSRCQAACTTTGSILAALRDFYCGPNGIFNLRHKYTARSERCVAFLDEEARQASPHTANRDAQLQEGESVEERDAAVTQRRCRAALKSALRADGRVLGERHRASLLLDNVFSAETVQQALDALTTETTPGRDGWPAHFYKVVGRRVALGEGGGGGDAEGDEEDDAGEGAPSALAALLACVFRRCADTHHMMDMMRDSTVSMIYKDKGKRCDLSRYRPIAVNSTLYRIMAKAMVVAMGPALSVVTSSVQRAFKPGEILQDNTRQVQDIIAYCAHKQSPGMLVFADQDGAYPRVSWDYLYDVMTTMNFPQEFISLVRTMYSGISLHFKVNGVVDDVAAVPANGIAQGCPASPCLYLLCIQGFISLIEQDARLARGVRGIAVPAEDGRGETHASVSAFADDLCLFLRDADQLPRFRQLLEVYEEGAGALNSWEKTEALRIGSLVGDHYLPPGWEEGKDIRTTTGVIRYLGIFLGAPERVAEEWIKRTTKRMQQKANLWRTRRMPGTRAGRGTALRNSILAQAWFLVNNQVPPNLSSMMTQWQRDAWDFYGNRNAGGTGGTDIRHDTLIQDYPDGGQRAPDVESFSRALQVSKITHLLQPSDGQHLNFLQYWMHLDYGLLRQGTRLLLSHCDFLRLSTAVPLVWRVFLKNVGSMPDFRAASGVGARVRRSALAGTQTAVGDIPQHRGELTLGEVLMEPVLLNPRIGGVLNSANAEDPLWEGVDRRHRTQCQLMRSSVQRRGRADALWQQLVAVADGGITHMVHLVRGWDAGAELSVCTWTEYRDRARAFGAAAPLSRQAFESLVRRLPPQWLRVIRDAAILKARNPTWTLEDLVRRGTLHPGTWVRRAVDGCVGRVEDGTPCVLHAFSGKAERVDGLARCLQERALQCREIDTVIHAKRHDLLCDTVYARVLAQARSGRFTSAVLGVPCSTFSAARIGGDGITAPAPVRGRSPHERRGLPGLTSLQKREVDNANQLVERSAALARAVAAAGGDVLFENPCDRGSTDDEDSTVRDRYRMRWRMHAPLWLHPTMVALRADLGLRAVTFPQCALGGQFQKWTTLWYTPRLHGVLHTLSACTCRHTSHAEVAHGRGLRGRWHSAEAAAYPAQMNEVIADAMEAAIQQRTQEGSHFSHAVTSWFPVDRAGRVDVGSVIRGADDAHGTQGVGTEQVHVWEQHALAACEHELQAWDRAAIQGAKQSIHMWCSGAVVDWDMLREVDGTPRTVPCVGSCNPAHWTWRHTHTDRTHEPTLVSDVDTHTIYFMLLSRLYRPMRTFATGVEAARGAQVGHTTWVDLLLPAALDRKEFVISRLVDDKVVGNGQRLYRVRWEGFTGEWDTWEPEADLADTTALASYRADGNGVARDRTMVVAMAPDGTASDMLTTLRARVMAGRVSHGINKLTAHKWESVLADAEPLGQGRCRKVGASHARCTACRCMLGVSVVESCRHAHLECPLTVRILAIVQRSAMQVMGTNLDARQETLTLSDVDLVDKHKLLLVTGYRLVDMARGSAAQRVGDTPLCVLIAETHAAIGDRRKRAEMDWSWRTFVWHEHEVYQDIHRRMAVHIRFSQQEAARLQVKRQIDNPGKRLEEDGPLVDWEKTWVATGWATAAGTSLMPPRASAVGSSGVVRTATPWAWIVPPALQVFWWRVHFEFACPSRVMHVTRQVQLITADSLIIYSDGSHDTSQPQAVAGFGFSCVRGDNGDDDLDARVVSVGSGPVVLNERSPVYLGADKHTNNTGELTALIEGMRWAFECDTRPDEAVLLRPDSDVAIGWTIGDLTPTVNHALVRTARTWYKRLLKQRKGRVYWRRVAGHSEHLRNDHVDHLAKEGAERTEWDAVVPRAAWLDVRGDGELLHNEGGWRGYNVTVTTMVWPVQGGWMIRQRMEIMDDCQGWVVRPGHAPSDVCNACALESNAVVRVERASRYDPFGVLNLMPYRTLRPNGVRDAGETWRARVRLCTPQVGQRRVDAAVVLVDQAVARLAGDAEILSEVDAVDGHRLQTVSLRCPVSLPALDAFIADPSSRDTHAIGTRSAGRTLRSSAQRLVRAVRGDDAAVTDPLGRTWVTLQYENSLVGSRMVASGHVIAAREMATGSTDPFKYGRAIRYLAMHEYGDEYDDGSSWPTAMAAMCPVGRDMALQFVQHKRVIYDTVGDFYFPNVSQEEKQVRIKHLNLRLDFDASIRKWEREWHITELASIMQRRCTIRLPGVQTPFDFRAYVTSLQQRTQWVAQRVPAMVDLARQIRSNGGERPEVTVKSSVLQEREGIGRHAKLRYCQIHGHWAFSQQHDGVGIGAMHDTDTEALRAALEQSTAAALGYAQRVTASPMPARLARSRVPWEREWPYDAQKKFVPGVADGHDGSAALITALKSRQGPAHAGQWDHDMVVVTRGQPSTRSWTRTFTVDSWNDAAVASICMEARRNYTHVLRMDGVMGAFTEDGQRTAWVPQ